MNGINSVKNYEYSFLVKKNKQLKKLKNGEEKVRWFPYLYTLLSFLLLLLIFPVIIMQSVFTDNSDGFCLFHKLLFPVKILEIKLGTCS